MKATANVPIARLPRTSTNLMEFVYVFIYVLVGEYIYICLILTKPHPEAHIWLTNLIDRPANEGQISP